MGLVWVRLSVKVRAGFKLGLRFGLGFGFGIGFGLGLGLGLKLTVKCLESRGKCTSLGHEFKLGFGLDSLKPGGRFKGKALRLRLGSGDVRTG